MEEISSQNGRERDLKALAVGDPGSEWVAPSGGRRLEANRLIGASEGANFSIQTKSVDDSDLKAALLIDANSAQVQAPYGLKSHGLEVSNGQTTRAVIDGKGNWTGAVIPQSKLDVSELNSSLVDLSKQIQLLKRENELLVERINRLEQGQLTLEDVRSQVPVKDLGVVDFNNFGQNDVDPLYLKVSATQVLNQVFVKLHSVKASNPGSVSSKIVKDMPEGFLPEPDKNVLTEQDGRLNRLMVVWKTLHFSGQVAPAGLLRLIWKTWVRSGRLVSRFELSIILDDVELERLNGLGFSYRTNTL